MRLAVVLAVVAVTAAGCGESEPVERAALATPTPVPATLFVSPTGSDQGACTRAEPCGSFAGVYRVAAPGDVVDVEAGDYGEQSIPFVEGRGGQAVELRAAAGADVRLTGLAVDGDLVTVRGMAIDGVGVDGHGRTVSDVELIDVVGTRLWVNDVRRLLVQGGSYGGVTDETPVKVGSKPSSHDVTFDGVLFHDARAKTEQAHLECAMVLDVQGLTVRNSRFRGCGVFGLLVGHLFGQSPRDVLIEGNVFEPTHKWTGEEAPYSMMVGKLEGPAERFVFRDNTFMTEPALLPDRFVDSAMVGNTGAGIGCRPGIDYEDNVWTQQPCGESDVHDPGALDP